MLRFRMHFFTVGTSGLRCDELHEKSTVHLAAMELEKSMILVYKRILFGEENNTKKKKISNGKCNLLIAFQIRSVRQTD